MFNFLWLLDAFGVDMGSSTLTVAVLGPKGQCGQCVVDELLSRGHNAIGISRDPPKEWKTAPPNSPGLLYSQTYLHTRYQRACCGFLSSEDNLRFDTKRARYHWPDVHLDYMRVRTRDHNQHFLSWFIRGFKWCRGNIENPGCEYIQQVCGLILTC